MQPKKAFAAMLATLDAVRTFLGVETAEAAAARIYVDMLPWPADRDTGYTRAELETLRPFILVSQGETQRAQTAHGVFGGMVEIEMTMEQDPGEGYDASASAFAAETEEWDATVDAVRAGIEGTAGDSSVTCNPAYEIKESHGWSPLHVKEDEGEFLGAAFSVTLGL